VKITVYLGIMVVCLVALILGAMLWFFPMVGQQLLKINANPGYLLVALVLAILLAGTRSINHFRQGGWKQLKRRIAGPVKAFLFTFVFGALFAFILMTNTVVSDSLIILNHNGQSQVVQYVGDGSILAWKWDPRFDEQHVAVRVSSLGRSVGMEVQPITENPKVRTIKYCVFLKFPETTPDWGVLWDRLDGDTPGIFIKRLLYDFNDQHSKELAKFNNPLRSEQQEEFQQMIENFLAPHLQGLKMSVATARPDFIYLLFISIYSGNQIRVFFGFF